MPDFPPSESDSEEDEGAEETPENKNQLEADSVKVELQNEEKTEKDIDQLEQNLTSTKIKDS